MPNKLAYVRFFRLISAFLWHQFYNFKINYSNNLLNNCSLKTLINACFGVYESKDFKGVFSSVKFFSIMSFDE